jgi:D-glycero-D-manno-heptose 1,7-bisphosphate phosphatase
MSRPAIFLDRDGVLVEEITYAETGEREAPLRAADVRLVPGAAAAVRRLQRAEFALILISNQGAHAKGKVDLRSLWLVHERFVFLLNNENVRLDGEYYSFSHPDGVVSAFSGPSLERKPSPYHILVAAARHDLDLNRSWMIGDRDTDVVCGRAAGTRTILIKDRVLSAARETQADRCVSSLAEAADVILGRTSQSIPTNDAIQRR